jgi:hypothetical protein
MFKHIVEGRENITVVFVATDPCYGHNRNLVGFQFNESKSNRQQRGIAITRVSAKTDDTNHRFPSFAYLIGVRHGD